MGTPEPTPPSTITDAEWADLQDRARRAHPGRADSMSDEGAAARHAANEQYAKRRWN